MLTATRYLLKGQDAYLIDCAVSILRSRIDTGFEQLCFMQFDKSASFDEVAAFCNTPAFGNTKVCAVTPPAVVEKKYLELFENTPQDVIIALVDTEDKFKFLEDVAEVIDCTKLSPQKARQMIASSGIDICENAVSLLVERVEGSGYRLKLELEKLAAFAPHGRQILHEDVASLVAVARAQDVFAFSNAVSSQNIREAYRVLTNLIAGGTNHEQLLPLLLGSFRKMLCFSLAKESAQELATLYKVKAGAVEINRKIAKRFGIRRLKDAVDTLIEIDYKNKSGQASVKELLWAAVAKI
jgi:DNA polymerase III delta subunit